MNDISRHLPFSQQEGGDETSVTGDWRSLTGETLTLLADLLEGLEPSDWQRQSMCEGWRVRDVAGHLVWRLSGSPADLARAGIGAVFRDGVSPLRVVDELSRRAARADPRELVASIRAIAAERVAARGRKGVRELTEAVVHGYDIARALDQSLAVPPVASGAVALARTLVARSSVKAIVSRRTLRATDAEWSVGRGPEFAAPASTIVLFLFGRIALASADDTTGAAPTEPTH